MAFRFVDEDQTSQMQDQQQPQRFRFVDEEEQAQPRQNKHPNPFAMNQASPEEYKNMSMLQKIQYAKDLEKEGRYEQSRAFTKNFAGEQSFGFTEKYDAFRPEEGEDPVAGAYGTLVGQISPIGLAGKAVKYGIKGAQKAIKYTPKAIEEGSKLLRYLKRISHGSAVGGVYESTKQGVKGASGQETDLSQIPKTAALFGVGEGALEGAGDIAKQFMKLSPKHRAQILEQGIIPRDLPRSQYETAEEIVNLIKQEAQQSYNKTGVNVRFNGEPRQGEPRSLSGRVSTEGQDLGLRPAAESTSLPDNVGNIFSRKTFRNSTEAGHALKNEISAIDEQVYREVNELYQRSRELNRGIDQIHPNLIEPLQNRIEELRAIPEPSDVQKRLLRACENILENLAMFGPNGQITGYLPMNNQTIINQIQSLRQIIDYDFAHGNTKNIFRPLIEDLQQSALRAAENAGVPEAAEAINNARNAYRNWSETFDNDYVRPFRNNSDHDYSKLFKGSLDLDEHNMLRNILQHTPRGRELINASTRDIVEKNLAQYFKNPREINLREFDKSLRELESVITPEQSQQIRNLVERERIRPSDITPEQTIAGKYLGKKPEYVQELMNSRSGIRELREDLSGSQQKRELFDRLSQQKMRSILREGNIEKEFTGDDLYKVLNKQKNGEIFSEILGEAEAEALRQEAKEIGKDQVKRENLLKLTKKFGSLKILNTIFDII